MPQNAVESLVLQLMFPNGNLSQEYLKPYSGANNALSELNSFETEMLKKYPYGEVCKKGFIYKD